MADAIEVPGGRIRFRESGSGPALVFVHGYLVDGRLWQDCARTLAGSGHRCIVPDWPLGAHREAMDPDADLSPPGVAAIIDAFCAGLGLERATVVGNDSGGALSQILAANHPERVERLVLTNCDTFEHFPPAPFGLLPRLARLPGGMALISLPFRAGPVGRAAFRPFAKRPIPAELIADWLAPSQRDPEVRRDLRKFTAGLDKRHTLAAAERLRSFGRPVRFAWAPEDRVFKISDARRLAAQVPDGALVEISGARTFVPHDQPEAVAAAIASFVAEPGSA